MRRAGGCTFAADPADDCTRASYLWTAEADPCVLRVRASCRAVGTAGINLSRSLSCAVPGECCVHVRFHLPDGDLRLDLVHGVILGGPQAIEPAIDLGRAIEPQVASLRRLQALMRDGLAAVSDQRLNRLVEALRVADAIAAGASLRDIGFGAFGDDWPGDGEHLKSRVRRRIQLAAELASAGPRKVLQRRI